MQVHNCAIDAVASLYHYDPRTGQFRDIIRRTQKARLAREVIVNLALVPDMIAAGQHVEAVTEQLVGQLRRDAEASGGVFGVGDGKVDFFRRDDFLQMTGHNMAPGRSKNIADKK